MSYTGELDTTLQIAREAGEIALSYFDPDRMGTRAKDSRDAVTEADVAAERHAVQRLMSVFPGDGVVAEGGGVTSSGPRLWFLDPLDGTMPFGEQTTSLLAASTRGLHRQLLDAVRRATDARVE